MTSLQESVDCGGCSSRIDSPQCVACCHPQRREMCHGALVEMERLVVPCGGGGGDGGHLSLSCLPPTIIHASILSLSFYILILMSSIFKAPSCLSLSSPSLWGSFIHFTLLTIWIPANESPYLRSAQDQIRVSFLIPYSLLSPVTAKDSQGNCDKAATLFHHYHLWCSFCKGCWNDPKLHITLNLNATQV